MASQSGGCGGRGTTATYCPCQCHSDVDSPCDTQTCGPRGSQLVKVVAASPKRRVYGKANYVHGR